MFFEVTLKYRDGDTDVVAAEAPSAKRVQEIHDDKAAESNTPTTCTIKRCTEQRFYDIVDGGGRVW